MFIFKKKYLNYLLTGSFSVVFAACYGTDMALNNPKLIKAKDVDNNPIPGLKVTLYENTTEIEQKYTDSEGVVEFYSTEPEVDVYKAVIEDVDGAENLGEFKTKEVDITNESYYDLNLDKQ